MIDKLFEKFFSLPLICILKPFWIKKREIVLYIFFGGLTTLVSFFSYALFFYVFHINEILTNVISWIFAVLFAFFTNRIWVFDGCSKDKNAFAKQLISFFTGRIFSLLVETLIIFIFVTKMEFNAMIIKIIASIFVLIINYIISKLFVFTK